jgi:hypothetical protein
MGGRGSSSGGRFGLGTTSAGNSRRPKTGPNSKGAQHHRERGLAGRVGSFRDHARRRFRALGADAYRPAVIQDMGRAVDAIVEALRRS